MMNEVDALKLMDAVCSSATNPTDLNATMSAIAKVFPEFNWAHGLALYAEAGRPGSGKAGEVILK